MKHLAAICLLTALCGCRVAIVPLPNGKTAFAASVLTEPQLVIGADGSLRYGSGINVPATTALAETGKALARLFLVVP